MLRPDTGNFNRFLTSVGLALMAASLIIPYFYFRDTGTLQIPRTELRALTITARDAIENRQHRVAQFETPILIFAGLLLVGGGAAVCMGGRRLLIAQRKDDDAVDLDRQVRREEYEVRHQSPEEIASSRDRQAKEAVVEESLAEDSAVQGPLRADGPEASEEDDLEERVDGERHHGTLAQTRAEIARVEETTQEVLRGAEFKRFRFLSEVRIFTDASGGQDVTLDGLFEAKVPNQFDIALDLRAVNVSVGFLPARFEAFSDQMLAQVARYKQVTGKEALGWLLIVLSRAAEPPSPPARRAVQREFNMRLGGLGRCTVLSETELNDLPNRFNQLFGH
jgi:hypothetical protein